MKKFKLYGYSASGDECVLSLREVTLFADSNQVRALSTFRARCAQEMETNPEWEHQHFADGKFPDIIVSNSQHKTGKWTPVRSKKKEAGPDPSIAHSGLRSW